MYQSVQDAFMNFSTQFEGKVNFMYLDIKGLVTIGIGNLIDPVDVALQLPFVHKSDGSPASQDEIRNEWNTLKSQPDLAQKGFTACTPLTNLMLTDNSIAQLVTAKLNQFASTLKTTSEFSNMDSWPADAQLGLLSMAWAMGPAFGASWPSFRAACAASDWSTAAANCQMNETGNPGLKPRNAADVLLFSNAAVVQANGLDFSVLHWPSTAQVPTSAPASGPVVSGLNPASGAGGDVITVNGSGFTGATDVGFGQLNAANMTVDSDSQLSATVPDGSGTVDVVVITPSGQSAQSAADQFTYTS
jgi:GH24 family phage-related lysozyme (muramidase)